MTTLAPARGRPSTTRLSARNADLREELSAERAESHDFAVRVRVGADRIVAAASVGSRMAVVNEAGKLGYLADRRLRQTDGRP